MYNCTQSKRNINLWECETKEIDLDRSDLQQKSKGWKRSRLGTVGMLTGQGADEAWPVIGTAGTKALCVRRTPTPPENWNLGERGKMKPDRRQNQTTQGLLGQGRAWVCAAWVGRAMAYEGASVVTSVSSPPHALIGHQPYQIKPHSPVSLSSSNQQISPFQTQIRAWGTMEKQWGEPNLGTDYIPNSFVSTFFGHKHIFSRRIKLWMALDPKVCSSKPK